METALDVAVFFLGLALVGTAVVSAVRTVILPRGAVSKITRITFLTWRHILHVFMGRHPSERRVDAVMAYYGPLGLFLVLAVWLLLVISGFTLMFWAVGDGTLFDSFILSGSSVFTLGFATFRDPAAIVLSFIEAAMGLTLLAMIITYLPSIYAAFSRRELFVTRLEVRAGSPPSGVHVITLAHELERLDNLKTAWEDWERWFGDIAESHSSFPVLVFFRSQRPEQHWVTSAGAILDAAAFRAAVLDEDREVEAELCIRAGYLALRQVADFFEIAYDADPAPDDPISVTRAEFEEALDALEASGLPVKADREDAWKHWAGWRVNYDTVLVMLCRLTLAPVAPWSSDRDRRGWAPGLVRHREGQVPRRRGRTADRAART